jgi:hypothetical protein
MLPYRPLITAAQPKAHFSLGEHNAVLFGNIKSVGGIEYLYVLEVTAKNAPEPCLIVTSEVNAMARSSRSGSHFLGVFEHIGRRILCPSDDWANLESFTERPLQIARNYLKLAP